METKSAGDKGLKTVGLFSLFSFPVLTLMRQTHQILWLLPLLGIGYIYFARLKYISDKAAGNATDKAKAFIIVGAVMLLFSIGSLIFAITEGLI
jgi:hypothetical protein